MADETKLDTQRMRDGEREGGREACGTEVCRWMSQIVKCLHHAALKRVAQCQNEWTGANIAQHRRSASKRQTLRCTAVCPSETHMQYIQKSKTWLQHNPKVMKT